MCEYPAGAMSPRLSAALGILRWWVLILWIALIALRHRLALAGPIDRLRLALIGLFGGVLWLAQRERRSAG